MRRLCFLTLVLAALTMAGCESGSQVFDVTGEFSIEHGTTYCLDSQGRPTHNMYCPAAYPIDSPEPFSAEVVTYKDRARIVISGSEWGTGSVTNGPGDTWEVLIYAHGQSTGSQQRWISLKGSLSDGTATGTLRQSANFRVSTEGTFTARRR